MKILAVSDIEDRILENMIENGSAGLKTVDCIISCGDLTRKYLEFITDGINKNFYFVLGNHFAPQFYDDFKSPAMLAKLYRGKGLRHGFGGIDMHGRVEIFGDYIIAGFGGSQRYNPGVFQFEEAEMERLVKSVQSSIRLRRLLDFVTFRKKRELIVISHAPVLGVHDKEDRCHSGFKCFRKFVFSMKPLLWLHGHIHLEGNIKRQQSVLDKTEIVNVYSSRIIEIEDKKVTVKQVYEK